ncbi:MAG TPA: crotonase/enoyl-CoA hydratase family protein [Acidimicrobiales bacterium]|nr:crotonase/enoyl-CoA hydratase family protein [Acidimicrobiales bacterium]
MEFASDVLTLKVDGHVATLWLDRVAARNAMGAAFWRDLPLAAAQVSNLPDVRVLVVAARGPDFTVGLDLKELGGSLFGAGAKAPSKAMSNAVNYREVRRLQDAVSSLASLAVPVIAAVHGYCIGGGVDLICAADIRLCSSDATFSVREAKVAIVADIGTLQRLPRIVSAGHVAELAFTGKDIGADRARAIGLVNSVHDGGAEAVYQAALELAQEIAANSPLAVQGTKAVLAANDGRTIVEGLEFVAKWNTMFLESNDLREAMTAFIEKRAPQFRGD